MVPGLVPDVVPPFGAGSELALRSILYIGKTSSITAGADLGRGGPGRSGTRCGTAFLGVPDAVPPFGAGTKDVVPGLVPDVVRAWYQMWYHFLGLEPEMWYQMWYHLFGAGTRDVVPGVLRSLFGLAPDLVPRPGTRAWY